MGTRLNEPLENVKKLLPLLLLAGCAAPNATQSYTPTAMSHKWIKVADVGVAQVVKIETDLSREFCTGMLGYHAIACAVRFPGGRCVVVMEPNNGVQAAHETGHCLGYDHK